MDRAFSSAVHRFSTTRALFLRGNAATLGQLRQGASESLPPALTRGCQYCSDAVFWMSYSASRLDDRQVVLVVDTGACRLRKWRSAVQAFDRGGFRNGQAGFQTQATASRNRRAGGRSPGDCLGLSAPRPSGVPLFDLSALCEPWRANRLPGDSGRTKGPRATGNALEGGHAGNAAGGIE